MKSHEVEQLNFGLVNSPDSVKETLYNSLKGINQFTFSSFKANFQYRFEGVPYLEDAFKNGEQESIAGHMWGVSLLWFHLSQVCPNLSSVVDSKAVYELLLHHDLGEVKNGDISMFKQVNSGIDKTESEREDLIEILEPLEESVRKQVLLGFDRFEGETSGSSDLEALVAKIIDNIHGNLFILAFGKNLDENSELENKIVKKHFGGSVGQLLRVLRGQGNNAAAEEVVAVMNNHIALFREKGVDLRPESVFS